MRERERQTELIGERERKRKRGRNLKNNKKKKRERGGQKGRHACKHRKTKTKSEKNDMTAIYRETNDSLYSLHCDVCEREKD